ncbi:DUF5703 family protein [Nocardioides sp. HDW12B]|uniref:DUF5703 family protein n=1 Tax=Nocardioides sp. HDW12B TaxID=2714939 RepID=UPI003211E0D9
MPSGSALPLHTSSRRDTAFGRPRRTAELEFERLTIPRDFSRSFVTRMLVDRAEHGGWELDRVRILADGTRKVVLRRKIIRQRSLEQTA